jgi:hypothetical protein
MPQFPSVSVPQLYSSLLTAARSIPRDPLRPSLQLPETLETLVQRAFKRPSPTVGASNAESSAIKELSQEEVTKLGFGIGDLTRLDRSLKAMQEINQDTAFRKVSPGRKRLSLGSIKSSLTLWVSQRIFASAIVPHISPNPQPTYGSALLHPISPGCRTCRTRKGEELVEGVLPEQGTGLKRRSSKGRGGRSRGRSDRAFSIYGSPFHRKRLLAAAYLMSQQPVGDGWSGTNGL